MGGKVWSRAEEDVFWKKLIPHSPKRLGKHLNNPEKSWFWVADQMTQILGQDARRKYTHLSVFEHYFQNTVGGRFSPHARRLPWKYFLVEQARKKELENQLRECSEECNSPASASPATGQSSIPAESAIRACQSPMPPSYPPPPRIPVVPAAPAPSSLAAPGSVPPQYYFDRYLANHDRMENTEVEDDGLFVTQPGHSFVDGLAPRGYGYRQ